MNFKATYRLLLLGSLLFCFASLKPSSNKPLQNGDTFPSLRLMNTNGDSITLSLNSEEYVLVEFWASWCGKCARHRSGLTQLVNEFQDTSFKSGNGLKMVTISLDDDSSKWRSALENYDGSMMHLRAGGAWNSNAIRTTGVSYLPYTFLLKPNGEIITQGLVGTSLRGKLERELKK